MNTYAIVDEAGLITNRAVVEDGAQWSPEAGTLSILEGDEAFAVGGTYIGGVYTPPLQPEPTPPLVSQVLSVTPRQARLALAAAGLLSAVNALIGASDEATQITWDYATSIERDWPLIVALGPHFGLSPEQIDQLFATAATL